MLSEHRLVFADARDLGFLPAQSIDLVVTSPPYPMIEMWDGLFASLSPQAGRALREGDGRAAFEAMHRELDTVWTELYRVLRPGGLACLNVGDATRSIGESFQMFPNHARVLAACVSLGFQVLPEILWRKPTNAPTKFLGSGMHPAGAYVTLEHEWILVLRKDGLRRFESPEERRKRRESSYFWEERNLWFSDVWELTGARQQAAAGAPRARSGAFPFEIAYRLVHMFSVRGDRVLDPFLGSGITLLAAMAGARHSVGVELDQGLGPAIRKAVAGVVEEANRRIAARLQEHLAFVRRRVEQGRPPAYINRPYGFPVITRQETELTLPCLTGVRAEGEDHWTVEYAEVQRHLNLADGPAAPPH
jgi:DNA modification methylase